MMGASVSANAIIGIQLARSPHTQEKVRGCSHVLKDEQSQFCDKCGKQAWREEEVPIPGYDEDDGTWGEFTVAVGGQESSEWYMGLNHVETGDCLSADDEAMIIIPEFDLKQLNHSLRFLLEPHGLWNPAKVGLWAFGNVCA